MINEKQEAIQQADSEIIELKNKLELCCSSKVAGGLNALDRLQELEKQVSGFGSWVLTFLPTTTIIERGTYNLLILF